MTYLYWFELSSVYDYMKITIALMSLNIGMLRLVLIGLGSIDVEASLSTKVCRVFGNYVVK